MYGQIPSAYPPTAPDLRPSDCDILGPLAERFVRLDSRAGRLRKLAARIARELVAVEAEKAALEQRLLDGMAWLTAWHIRLNQEVTLTRCEAARPIVPLWPPSQFPAELRREVLVLDEDAIRVDLGASEVLVNEDGLELARLGPAPSYLEIRPGDISG